MGKYGKAAVIALELLRDSRDIDPSEAWYRAVSEVFPESPSARDKGCPKGAFLGLCSEGFIRGVQPGAYTRSSDNRRYAVQAAQKLRVAPSFAERPQDLWAEIMQGKEKTENSQMDVVISLWKSGAIETPDV